MDLKLTFSAGEVCPEYDILKPDGRRAKDHVDYVLSARFKDKGIFVISITELYVVDHSGIIVRESIGNETHYHVQKNDEWIETTDVPGEKKVEADPKKKPIKIEFAEEPPTAADRDIVGMIAKWCFSEKTARSYFKRPDGTVKISAVNKDVGPQLETKIENYFLYNNINAEVKETTEINGQYFITVGQKDDNVETEKMEIKSAGPPGVLEKIHNRILHDPEVKMLFEKFDVQVQFCPGDGALFISSPARYVKEMILIVEGITDDSVVVFVDKRRFGCSIMESQFSDKYPGSEIVPIDRVHEKSLPILK